MGRGKIAILEPREAAQEEDLVLVREVALLSFNSRAIADSHLPGDKGEESMWNAEGSECSGAEMSSWGRVLGI